MMTEYILFREAFFSGINFFEYRLIPELHVRVELARHKLSVYKE